MKRLLTALSLLAMGGLVYAGDGPVAISSGSNFYAVDTSSMATGYVRQRIVIGDPTVPSGLAPISGVTGMTVNLASSSYVQPTYVTNPTSATITGSISNTAFGATQANAFNVVSTNTIISQTNALNVVSTNTAITQPNALNVVSTSTLSNQGSAGTADWPVRLGTTTLAAGTANIGMIGSQSGFTVTPGTGTFNIAGSITSSAVNITTAAANGALPTAGSLIGGVSPTGQFQSFRTDASSNIFVNISSAVTLGITGSITSASVNITTAAYNATLPVTGSALGYINGSGLTQSPRVNVASETVVAISTAVALTVNTHAVTQSGTFTVNVATGGVTAILATGANAIGSITNTSFAISTGGVTAVLGTGSNAIGSITNTTFGATQANAFNVVSTATVANQGTAGTADWPVRVATVTINNTSFTDNQGTAGTADWPVRVSSVTVFQSTVTIMAPNNNTTAIPVSGSLSANMVNVTTVAYNAAFPAQGSSLIMVGPTGLAQSPRVDTSSNTFTTPQLLISSAATLPLSRADTSSGTALGDNKGRLINRPLVPWGMIKVATTTITTDVTERVFISSGGAGVANNLIGCIGENTSATATDITFRPTGPTAAAAGSFPLGLSASNIPVGFFPPTGIPQPVANLNSNWTVQAANSVTSLKLTCWYWSETQ